MVQYLLIFLVVAGSVAGVGQVLRLLFESGSEDAHCSFALDEAIRSRRRSFRSLPTSGDMADRIIEWVGVPLAEGWNEEPDAHQWIDVALFDVAWRQTPLWIGPGGIGGLGDRYAKFGQWVLQGHPVQMCSIGVDKGQVGFADGRHRFAWLRDHGVEAVKVQIAPKSVPECARRFYTGRRASVLTV
jgi:hypothetical protein